MSGKYFIFSIRRPVASATSLHVGLLLIAAGFLVSLTHGIPVEVPDESSSVSSTTVASTTTVKILIPPSSGSGDEEDADDDDAIIIEGGNSNSTNSSIPAEPFDPSDCFLAKLKGPCRAIIDMWYFNVNTKQCEQFHYSGCGGNGNRFSDKTECVRRCGRDAMKDVDHEAIVIEEGAENSTCPKFDGCGPLKCAVIKDDVTGCQKCACAVPGENEDESSNLPVGSVSGTPSEDEEKMKSEKPEDICSLPEVRGDCRAMVTRYRYDSKSKKCIMFHFGGCNSNGNNFVSEEKCSEFCKGQ